MFKRNNHVTDQLYETEQINLEIEYRESVDVGLFILRNATLRMLEFH